MKRVGVLGVLALGTSGCLALPFAAPPTSVSVAPGVALGRVAPPERGGVEGAHAVVTGRVGVRPFGLVEGYEDRRFGMQAGYLFEVLPRAEVGDFTKHGGFVGITYYPWISGDPGDSTRLRLGLNVDADVLRANVGDLGGGMAFTTSFETVSWGEGAFDSGPGLPMLLGGAAGEFGIGLQATGAVRGVGTARYWLLTGGLTVRLPAIGGLLLVPLTDLD